MRHATAPLLGCLLGLLAAAPAAADTRSPLLKVDSSFTFPAHCDSGGCVDASQVDFTAFLFRDGRVLEVASVAARGKRPTSSVTEGALSESRLAELVVALGASVAPRQRDCEIGGEAAPTGEEVWTWYRWSSGAYKRFRIVFAPRGTTGLPQCSVAIQELRSQVLGALP